MAAAWSRTVLAPPWWHSPARMAGNISWPEGEVRQKGEAPGASRIAAGLDRPAAVDPKARAAMLIASLRAEPTEQEWLTACAQGKVGEDVAAAAWGLIEQDGWDATVKITRQRWQGCQGGLVPHHPEQGLPVERRGDMAAGRLSRSRTWPRQTSAKTRSW